VPSRFSFEANYERFSSLAAGFEIQEVEMQQTLFETQDIENPKPQAVNVQRLVMCDNTPVRDFTVDMILYKQCKQFCEEWHYSKTCPAGKYYFGLYRCNELIGVICYGEPAMRNQKKCYGADIELRRLCCIDDTPKNTESFFIGNTLRKLKKIGIKKVLSLADPNFGHSGTIYKASNFVLLGEEQGGGSRDIFIDGVKIHSRTAFAKYGASGQKKLSELLPNSKVEVRNKIRKLVYAYELNTERSVSPTRKMTEMLSKINKRQPIKQLTLLGGHIG